MLRMGAIVWALITELKRNNKSVEPVKGCHKIRYGPALFYIGKPFQTLRMGFL
jgi:hypothetical protein